MGFVDCVDVFPELLVVVVGVVVVGDYDVWLDLCADVDGFPMGFWVSLG